MPSRKPPPSTDARGANSGWPALALLAIIGFLAALHFPFVAWHAYGSDDAAWDGIAIMLWSQHQRLPTEAGLFIEERFRSSPLPAYVTRQLLVAGLLRHTDVPVLMNVAASLAGVLLPGLLYFLVRHLASAVEATIAVILLLLSPEFFSLKLDSLSTLPAAFLFLLSLLCFVRGMQPTRWGAVLLLLAGGFLMLATLTKVDVILLSPALLVAALMMPLKRARWKYLALSLALPLVCVAVWHVFCRWAAPDAPTTGESFQRWSQRWEFLPSGLLDPDNRKAMLMAPGVGVALALVPAAVLCWLARPTRWLTVAALACMLPTILFWGLRELNSSRHNFWLVLPMAVLVAVAVHRAIGPLRWKVLVVAAIAAGNYFLGPGPQQETYRQATSHFLWAALMRQVRVQKDHDDYELLVRKRGSIGKLCIWDVGPARARAIATFVAHADRCDVRVVGKSHNDWRLEAQLGGDKLHVWLPDAPNLTDIWPEICRGEYHLLMPSNESVPFFHARGSPQAAGSAGPQAVELWPADPIEIR